MPTPTAKPLCVVVIGASGLYEGRTFGVGKSWLCNRLVRPRFDDFTHDHSSVFSSIDFEGTVLNKEHFLYWGSTRKRLEEGELIDFRVVEQTEFIDDVFYQPLNKQELMPYPKRCSAVRLTSPGKIMYINRDQVALQPEYDQVYMPDGKLNVDAFVCVYDVSLETAEKFSKLEAQENILGLALDCIVKTKKPATIALTKCDQVSDAAMQRAYRFAQARKLQVIETSAAQNVNVEEVLVCLFSKSKARSRYPPFEEALKAGLSMRSKVTDGFVALLKGFIVDCTVTWEQFMLIHRQKDEVEQYIVLEGVKVARELFNKVVLERKKELEEKRLTFLLARLESALVEFFPTLHSIEANRWRWDNCIQSLKGHKRFASWFEILPPGRAWNQVAELLNPRSDLIPYDVLGLVRCQVVFDKHVKKLGDAARKAALKKDMRKLLSESPGIVPGDTWEELGDKLAGSECCRSLDEADRLAVFDAYMRDLKVTSKTELHELLFEHAPVINRLAANKTPSSTESVVLEQIEQLVGADPRYRNLDKIAVERQKWCGGHLGHMHDPKICLNGSGKCMDRIYPSFLEMLNPSNQCSIYENHPSMSSSDYLLPLLVLGSIEAINQLELELQKHSSSSDSLEYILDGRIYSITLQSSCQPSPDFASIMNSTSTPVGCVAVFSENTSLQLVNQQLLNLRAYLSSSSANASEPFPTVMLLACDFFNEDPTLRQRAQVVADSCEAELIVNPFMSVQETRGISETQINDALNRLVLVYLGDGSRFPNQLPDLRILLCCMCGDSFPLGLILQPLLHKSQDQDFHVEYTLDNPDKIFIDTTVCGQSRRIAVVLSSYHKAYSLLDQNFHGYILSVWSNRKASVQAMSALVSQLPPAPVQVLAIKGASSTAGVGFQSVLKSNEVGFSSADALATRILAGLKNSSPSFEAQVRAFSNFFEDAMRLANVERLKQVTVGRSESTSTGTPELRQRSCSLLGSLDQASLSSSSASGPCESLGRRSSLAATSTPSDQHHANSLTTVLLTSMDGACGSRPEEPIYADVRRTPGPPVVVHSSGSEDDSDVLWEENPSYSTGQHNLYDDGSIEDIYEVIDDVQPEAIRTPTSFALVKDLKSVSESGPPALTGTKGVLPTSGSSGSLQLKTVSGPLVPGERREHDSPKSAPIATLDTYEFDHNTKVIKSKMDPHLSGRSPYDPDKDLRPVVSAGNKFSLRKLIGRPDDKEPLASAPVVGTIGRSGLMLGLQSYNKDNADRPANDGQPIYYTLDHRRAKRDGTKNDQTLKQKLKGEKSPDVPSTESREKNRTFRIQRLVGDITLRSSRRSHSKELDKLRTWEVQRKKPQASSYFGKSLNLICPENSHVPEFVLKCVEYMEAVALEIEGIYRKNGNVHDVKALQAKFEEEPTVNFETLGYTAHTIASSLKSFFGNLPEPLLPPSFYKEITDVIVVVDEERISKLAAIVVRLPQPNREVYKFLSGHLNRVSKHEESNKMSPANLAICFCPSLMRTDAKDMNAFQQTSYLSSFVQTCIEQPAAIFDVPS